MSLELGNFKYVGERFYINGEYVKFSRLRYNLLKILCDNYGQKPVSVNKILEAMYDDIDDRRDEPKSKSYRVIIHSLKQILYRNTDYRLGIKSHNGLGYSLEFNPTGESRKSVKLTKHDIEKILHMHESGRRATSIATEYGISRHKVYDILIRSKQSKILKDIYGENYDKKRFS